MRKSKMRIHSTTIFLLCTVFFFIYLNLGTVYSLLDNRVVGSGFNKNNNEITGKGNKQIVNENQANDESPDGVVKEFNALTVESEVDDSAVGKEEEEEEEQQQQQQGSFNKRRTIKGIDNFGSIERADINPEKNDDDKKFVPNVESKIENYVVTKEETKNVTAPVKSEENSKEDVENTRKSEGTSSTGTDSKKNEKTTPYIQNKAKQFLSRISIFRIFEKPISESRPINYFRNELQNDFSIRNGLFFSSTSVHLYNKYVDSEKYTHIRLPGSTMIILVTANKLFFQDLIYSNKKYLSIKNKFAYLMNTLIDHLKTKPFFKNYNYQYLFRNDPFAVDPAKKLLDFDLLGDLSQVTQTIYTDGTTQKKVSMHRIYGGWFQFLGILVVNGYYYNETVRPNPIEVVPYNMLNEFREVINQKPNGSSNYAQSLGLWRDFPNEKYAIWRYSLELLLWDSLNILPSELPHPAKFVMAYTNDLHEELNYKETELDFISHELSLTKGYTLDELKDWHLLIKQFVNKHLTGIDVAIVSVDDYYKKLNSVNTTQTDKGESNEIRKTEGTNGKINRNGYALLFLLNAEFYKDLVFHERNYIDNKRKNFFKKIVAVIEKIQSILNEIKHILDPELKPELKFYNYLNVNPVKYHFNPHVLGSVAGITQHLKCENVKYIRCTKDVSMHFKYGGWFEFGGVVHLKNIPSVPLEYEQHEIIKKEFENAILLQANSNYQVAGLWKDIPEKDTSAYRYPLHVFVLEHPQLNIIDIQRAHPYIIVDLVNKGLQLMKHNAKWGDKNKEPINEFLNGNKSSFGKKELQENVMNENVMNENVMNENVMNEKVMNEKMNELKGKSSSSSYQLNFGEPYTPMKINESEIVNGNDVDDDTVSSNESTNVSYNVTKKNDNTIETTSENNGYNTKKNLRSVESVESSNSPSEEANDVLNEEQRMNRESNASIGLGGEINDTVDTLVEEEFWYDEEERKGEVEEVTETNEDEIVEYTEEELNEAIIGDSESEEGKEKGNENENENKRHATALSSKTSTDPLADSLIKDYTSTKGQTNNALSINEFDEVYGNNTNENDLNTLSVEDEKSRLIIEKVLLSLLVVFATVVVGLAILMAIKLYDRYSKKKLADKNEIVLGLKQKDEIPVVHGMPAPWLNA